MPRYYPRMSLRERIATPDGKRRYVRALFATIADRYDFITVRAVVRPGPALEAAAGRPRPRRVRRARASTSPPAPATSRSRSRRAARGRRPRHHAADDRAGATRRAVVASRRTVAAVRFLVGDMLALPFPAASFDIVTTGYGLRNVPDLASGDRRNRPRADAGRPAAVARFQPAVQPPSSARPISRISRSSARALGWVLHRDPDTYRYIPASIRKYPGADGGRAHVRSARLHRGALLSGARRTDDHSPCH